MRGKSGDFGLPKKGLDKGPPSVFEVSPFQSGGEIERRYGPKQFRHFYRRYEAGAFFQVNLASLYQRKGLREELSDEFLTN